jgi:hypothetical protein
MSRSMSSKTFWILFAIAAVMRVAFIWSAPLWYDENFTLILARLPFERMIQATAGDVHPPLWYLIEWTLFHAAPSLPAWAIRIPALIFSLAAFLMFVHFCCFMRIPNRVQVFAVFLTAVLPMQIWYAQEGRMYALLEFLVLAALVCSLSNRWFWFTVAATAMLYTQNYGVFYLTVIVLIAALVRSEAIVKIAISCLIAVVLYSPWSFVIASQMSEISGRYWIMDVSVGAVLNAVYKQFWTSAMMEPGIIASYVITFAALIVGIYSVMREKIHGWWVVVTMAFAPVSIAWIVSVLWQPLLLFRPLIGISPFLYLIVSWPLMLLPMLPTYFDMRKVLYAACFIMPMLMLGIAGYYLNISAMKGEGVTSPLLSSLDYVRANWQDGDVIYYADDGPMINLMPYTSLPQYKMPACGERIGYGPVLGSLSNATRIAIGSQIAYLADVPHKRAWVFAPRSPLHPQCYEDQIASIAPEGKQLITVDDSEYITSGIWLVEK